MVIVVKVTPHWGTNSTKMLIANYDKLLMR
jgi:hypothetical protein